MEAHVEKLLISGVDTPIGINLFLALQDRWQAASIGSPSATSDATPDVVCDLADSKDVQRQLAIHSPAWVVHCGDWSRGSWDAAGIDVEPAHAAHQAATLAQACRAQGTRLCVITSDAQFAGPRMFHAEDTRSTATSNLAETNRAIEAAVRGPGTLIVRSHAYGWSPFGDESSFAQRVWRALSEGRDCPVDDDRYATPMLVTDLAECLDVALTQCWHGVYHLAGIERTNQRRFAAELAVAFGFTGRVVPLVSPDAPVGRRLVDETSLNTGLARRQCPSPLPMLREGLIRLAALYETDWCERLETLAHVGCLQQRAA
jgi:dTDP-4-dehydrorhamnose reductase